MKDKYIDKNYIENVILKSLPIAKGIIENDEIHDDIHDFINVSMIGLSANGGLKKDNLCPLIAGCLAVLAIQGKIMIVKMEGQ